MGRSVDSGVIRSQAELMSGNIPRRLTAILSADIAGYSRLMGNDEAGTLRALKSHQDAVFPLVPRYDGRIIDVAGDGILAEFSSVVAAVECAVEIQRVMDAGNAQVPEERRLRFRIGVHLGDVIFDESRIYGEGINVAARIQALASPGGIAVSQTVFEQVRHKIDQPFVELGEARLKNIRDPVVIHQAVLPWCPAPAMGQVRRLKGTLGSRRVRWGMAVAALVVVGATIGHLLPRATMLPSESNTEGRSVKSVAILPFRALDARMSEGEYLGVGLADALITNLGTIHGLVVRPTSAVLRYNKPDQDPFAAGREQKVDVLLEGTMQRAGQRLRLNVRLLRVRDGASLWAAKFDEDLTDLFRLQDSIAEQATRAMVPRLTGDEGERLARRYTRDVKAYDLYLQGRYHLNRFGEENVRKAIALFEAALERDSSFALPSAGIALAHAVLTAGGHESYEQGGPAIAAAATKALAIDESLAEAHLAQGINKFMAWDIDGARRELDRVVELNPNIPETYSLLGYLYQLSGRVQDAVGVTQKGVEINPLSPLVRLDLSEAYYYTHDWKSAISEYDRVLERDAGLVPPFFIPAQALERQGDWAGAIARCEAAIQKKGREPAFLSALGYAHASAGHRAEAVAVARELEERWRKQPFNPSLLALLHAGIGNRDRAFEWADRAYEAHDVQILFLGVEPQAEGLRSDPRFAAFMRKVGL